MAAERVPEYAEWPGYGIYPCEENWHSQSHGSYDHDVDDTKQCPVCGNRWWARDGSESECPEEYALVAEIDQLRSDLFLTRSLLEVSNEAYRRVRPASSERELWAKKRESDSARRERDFIHCVS